MSGMRGQEIIWCNRGENRRTRSGGEPISGKQRGEIRNDVTTTTEKRKRQEEMERRVVIRPSPVSAAVIAHTLLLIIPPLHITPCCRVLTVLFVDFFLLARFRFRMTIIFLQICYCFLLFIRFCITLFAGGRWKLHPLDARARQIGTFLVFVLFLAVLQVAPPRFFQRKSLGLKPAPGSYS